MLIVTIDSCAARNMPCYGYDRNTTPNFCKFASDNIFFSRSYANAPWTLPSHVSLFTGLFPSNHGVNQPYTDPLPKSVPLLSDIFHTKGYETIFYMPAHNEILSDTIIYNRGMSQLVDNTNKPDDDIDAALRHLQKNIQDGKKTFMSLYSQQCHYPYLLNKENKMFTNDSIPEIPIDAELTDIPFTEGFYRNLLETSKVNSASAIAYLGTSENFYSKLYETLSEATSYADAARRIEAFKKDPIFSIEAYRTQYLEYYYSIVIDPKNQRYMNYLRALYDQVLYKLDQGLLTKIARSFTNNEEIKKNTILIITAEHGEEFGEHEIYGHTTLYDFNLRVPLVMRIPNIESRTIHDPVQSVDIMPTLLDLVGIPHNYNFDGTSILPLLQNKQIPTRLLVADNYLTSQFTKSIIYGDWKVFVSTVGGYTPYMLYNLAEDPNEQKNILLSNFPIANTILDAYLESHTK